MCVSVCINPRTFSNTLIVTTFSTLYRLSYYLTSPLSLSLSLAVTSIHAKFDVTNGPSLPQPAEVKFVCDGSTLSGVDLELNSSDYRVSLLKRKFSSGRI